MSEFQSDLPNVRLVGELPVKLWGLPLDQWQSRTWKKMGAAGVAEDGDFCVGSDWVLSPALAIRTAPGVANRLFARAG
ncbi:MAG: hypothetical protein AAFQ24_12675, partial [Pseudomonadota bacterium]